MTTPGLHRATAGFPAPGHPRRPRPVIGVLQDQLLGLYAEEWLGSVDAARAHGCDLITFCGRALVDGGLSRLNNSVYDLATEQTLDGLIVWTQVLAVGVGQERTEEYCRRFAGLPIVSVELPLGDAPAVLMDNRQGMYDAVSHLIQVHGRRRIAFTRGPITHQGSNQRYQGYLDAMADHGLPVPSDLVTPVPGRSSDPGKSRWADWPTVLNTWLSTLLETDPPDAIAAAHDDNAAWALSRLAGAGVRSPEDVPVVGFDDSTSMPGHILTWNPDVIIEDMRAGSQRDQQAGQRAGNVSSLVSSLSLTTVRAPFYEMGWRAVEAVLGLVHGETVPSTITVPTELVVRRSCGCHPSTDQLMPPVPGTDQGTRSVPERPVIHRRQPAEAGLPEDWGEQLAAAFVADMRADQADAFPELLDQFMQVSLWSGESVETWWRVLSTLRELIGGPTASAAEIRRGDDLWLHAQLLLNETTGRQRHYAQVLTEKRNQIVREIGQKLVISSDLAELADVLAEALPQVGIPSCYLAAYEAAMPDAGGSAVAPAAPTGPVSTARSRMLLAYEDGARADISPDRAVFPSACLVPDDHLLHRTTPYSMVAVPLFFKDQLLGFALLELGPAIGWVYAALREQVSSALHRVFMVEREHAAVAALEVAHRREERHRLASELHDSVSQALFSMTLHTRAVQLAVQQQGWEPQHRIVRGLADLRELTQSALTEMRALIFQLRPDALREEGLVAAIRKHAAAVAAREEFAVVVHASDDRLHLPERAEEELFRIVQEALHNTVKHAQPSRVDIRLDGPADAGGTLTIEIADDGSGFDPDLPRPGHVGLESMGERAGRLGGQFTIHSSPSGSTVRVVLPDILRREPTDDTSATSVTDREGTG